MARIEAFGRQNGIDGAVIRHMVMLAEELGVAILMKRFGPEADIDIAFEYSERTGETRMQASFEYAHFDPLGQGDPIPVALIRIASEDWASAQEAGRRVLTCRVK